MTTLAVALVIAWVVTRPISLKGIWDAAVFLGVTVLLFVVIAAL